MLKAILILGVIQTATASIGCVVAPCQDSDAQLHESTCLSRCDCIWDSEGVPKSKTYPSCLSAPDTAEVHVTSFKGSVETYVADDITGFQLCQDMKTTCPANEYKDPSCSSPTGDSKPESEWDKISLDVNDFDLNFIKVDEPMPKYKHTKKIHSTKSMWGLGKGWTACASENSHKLEQGTCPTGYCVDEKHHNVSHVPWACCSKCPGGTKQCLDNCMCRCTKECTKQDPTPTTGGKCNCGPSAKARYGNGDNWSPTQIVDGEFTCESATFGATAPGVVPDSKGHCECDHSDSIGENGNCGSGYSQCSNYAIEKSSGSLAIYNNKGEGDLQLENYQFKVDILHSGGTHASVGVVFRYQDSKNYYRVVLTSWCTTLIRVTNGKSTKITGHYKSKGGGYPRGSNGKDSDWFTLGVAVESNDITVTVDHESQNGDGTSILRMVQEENPTKTIVRGSFGFYSSQGKGSYWKNLRWTKDLCHHVANIIIPTKNVDNWEVLSFHATSTAGEVGALLVATTTGFLSNDHFKCTDVNPTSLGATAWYKTGFDDSKWARAVVVKDKSLVHPHDIVGAANWIWLKDNQKAINEIWCRGIRGTESLVWHGNQYFVEQPKKSWEGAELQCQSLGPTCHLASIHGVEEAEMMNTMAQSVFGHNQAMWLGVNDRAIENEYVNADGTMVDWLNWNKGEPNDVNHNEDCVEFHTWDGHWNDNRCDKANPSICKCPDDQPEDPSSSDDMPDDKSQEEGDDIGSTRTCSMYMGGLGSGTSWFDAPAQPYDGQYCNVFGTQDSCCSSAWVIDNVEYDINTLNTLITPDNTGCANAVEGLRCLICSPKQSTFMSEVDGIWNVDVCYSTAHALFQFCKTEDSTLFASNETASLTPEDMVTSLTTRMMGDTGDNPAVLNVNVNFKYGKCFLHDTMSPKLLNASYNGTALHLIFDEPLSTTPVGIHVDVTNNINSTGTSGDGTQPLVTLVRCNSASCIKGVNEKTEFDGEVIWSVKALDNTNDLYETTNMLQDTVVIPTTRNGMPTYSPTGSANAEDVIADDRYRQGSAKFGYVVWLADNSVFDIAGNSFAGSDMDLDGVVFVNLAQEKYCGFSCWFPFVIAGIVGVMVAGFVGYELYKRSKGESTCLCNRDGNNKSENSFFSSGGYVAVDA